VLSILLTAPLGAVGIGLLGERWLERSEHPVYRFKQLREKLALPRVGENVRSRRHGTVWKVIEEKEVWVDPPATAAAGTPVPALYLRFWKEEGGRRAGTGRTLTHRYSQSDASFNEHWEILYDW
jgi:hypothetical protein